MSTQFIEIDDISDTTTKDQSVLLPIPDDYMDYINHLNGIVLITPTKVKKCCYIVTSNIPRLESVKSN